MTPPTARVLVVQHVDFGGLGRAAAPLAAAGVTVEVCRTWCDPVPDSLVGYAGLLVLGGPQAAFSDAGFPTRAAELALVRQATATGLPYLGICLGAQLLAHAAGARGYRGDHAEIGWHPVTSTDDAAGDLLWDGLPGDLTVMQSHLDHYDLPEDAVLLATGAAYPHQAFRVGPRAWGFQFHLEAGPDFAASRRAFVPGWAADESATDVTGPGSEAALLEQVAPVAATVFTRFAELTQPVAQPLGA